MLAAGAAGGIALDTARTALSFRLSADADQFLTTAKFRALRKVWARVEEACGLAPHPVAEPAQRLEKFAALLRRQYSRRFVEDDSASAADQRLQDLDALFYTDREGRNPLARIDLLRALRVRLGAERGFASCAIETGRPFRKGAKLKVL